MTGSPAKCLSISDILAATQGELLRGNLATTFSGVSIDSRTIKPGELFWTLRGDRFDSHQFVVEAIVKGSAGVVVSQNYPVFSPWPMDQLLIRVADRLQALQETGRYLRQQFPVPLVAVTGSNGKTSTKEMIASILSCQGKVLKTKGNLNNLIGLPLTLCRLSSEIDFVALELGMNAMGEIQKLTKICQPDVAVITNIGPAHIGYLGSMEHISRAKGELFEEMGSGGVAVVNEDDPYCRNLAKHVERVITFGLGKKVDVWAENIRQKDQLTFTMHIGGESLPIRLPLLGRYNVYNALAAASAARALNISLASIREGLEKVVLPPMRMSQVKCRGGYTIINDAYNANPVSMCLAIETLVRSKAEGRAILVLGDMLELGSEAERFHREVGRIIALNPIDFLFTCGQLAHWIAEEALAQGMKKEHVFFDFTHQEIAKNLKTLLVKGDSVLVKGSRGAGMERVVELLVDD